MSGSIGAKGLGTAHLFVFWKNDWQLCQWYFPGNLLQWYFNNNIINRAADRV